MRSVLYFALLMSISMACSDFSYPISVGVETPIVADHLHMFICDIFAFLFLTLQHKMWILWMIFSDVCFITLINSIAKFVV